MTSKITYTLLFVLAMTCTAFGQNPRKACKPNKYYKYNNLPGLLTGYHYPGHRFELGVSKILYLREKKGVMKEFDVRYRPPFLVEAALSTEFDFKPDFLLGPGISAWFTPFSVFKYNTDQFFGNFLYNTLGYVVIGGNLNYYTNFDKSTLSPRFEAGYYSIFEIVDLFKRNWRLYPRLIYGYNGSSSAIKNFGLPRHQVSFKMTIYWKQVGKN